MPRPVTRHLIIKEAVLQVKNSLPEYLLLMAGFSNSIFRTRYHGYVLLKRRLIFPHKILKAEHHYLALPQDNQLLIL
jgi:hypothetical protein